MALYLRALGALLIVLGIVGTISCWRGVLADDAYYRAAKGLEKYPANVLFQTEFKMAEPRHMLLLAGAYGSVTAGLVFGSMCLGIGSVLSAGQNRT
jgi:hypothetical protein